MRTDTRWIPVIEPLDVQRVCTWCRIPLTALGPDPETGKPSVVETPHGTYHPGCERAETRSLADALTVEFDRIARS